MEMDPKTGTFRMLQEGEGANEGEVSFAVGEEVEIKGGLFTVTGIDPDPENRISLKGIPKS